MKPYQQMSREELLLELAEKDRRTDSDREITIRLLNLLNTGDCFPVLMESLLCFFQELSGCDAVGARLRDGDDFPYFQTRGFPGSFVKAENWLCVQGPDGQTLRDEVGNPVLECVCGNILSGRFDAEKPFYTAHGSFWTNSTSDLLASPSGSICPGTTRNRCNSAGYESVALIPLKSRGEVLGLMQFNDLRKGRLSADSIALWERLADSVAIAVVRGRADKALQRSEETLGKSEQRLRFHLENSPLAVVEWDADFLITQWSSEAERIFGWRSAEVLGKPLGSLNLVHAEDAAIVNRITKRLNGGKERTVVASHRNLTKSGTVIDCSWYYSVLLDQQGQMSSVLSLVQDVTEHKRTQGSLLKSRNELKLANELLEQRVKERTAELESAICEQESFSYSVSHDLRAPLRHINSFSYLLIEDFGNDLPKQARTYLNRIIGSTGRMSELIDHLLELSRVTRAEVKPGIVDLSKMAISTLDMFQDTDPRDGSEFVVEKGITAMGDKVLLRQLLANLLGNAWKYTSKKPSSRIQFGKTTVGGDEAYYVRDNGTGFDMAYRERLFNAFERLHGEEFEGVGIGLATAQRIVRRHGGRIWAEGAVDQGATFYFTLPVYLFKEA